MEILVERLNNGVYNIICYCEKLRCNISEAAVMDTDIDKPRDGRKSVERGGAWFNDVSGLAGCSILGLVSPVIMYKRFALSNICRTQYTEHHLYIDLYAKYV